MLRGKRQGGQTPPKNAIKAFIDLTLESLGGCGTILGVWSLNTSEEEDQCALSVFVLSGVLPSGEVADRISKDTLLNLPYGSAGFLKRVCHGVWPILFPQHSVPGLHANCPLCMYDRARLSRNPPRLLIRTHSRAPGAWSGKKGKRRQEEEISTRVKLLEGYTSGEFCCRCFLGKPLTLSRRREEEGEAGSE